MIRSLVREESNVKPFAKSPMQMRRKAEERAKPKPRQRIQAR